MYTFTSEMRIGEKIRRLRKEKGIDQKELAALVRNIPGLENYSYQKIGHIEQGRRKRVFDIEIDAFSRTLFISRDYLLDNTKDYPPSNGDRLPERPHIAVIKETPAPYGAPEIHVITKLAADGTTALAYNDAGYPPGEGMYQIERPPGLGRHAYGAEVDGNSMEPGLPHGSRIIADPQSRQEWAKITNGDVVIVRLADSEKAYVKQIKTKGNGLPEGFVMLKSSKDYDPIVTKKENIDVLHKVVWVKMP